MELRTTIEFVCVVDVNSTYWPVLLRRTDLRPEDSVAKLVCPNVRGGSASSSCPWYCPFSAAYETYGTAAPRPTTIATARALLLSLVSATVLVASAVAVTVAPPLVAVQVPTLTLTVAP